MNKQTLSTIIFFGAIWGLLEATLGYLLQFLPPLISGAIMFPIGAAILLYVSKNTESKSALLAVGFVAALIKAINFFMPGLPPIKTYNPMIAIMMQSIMVLITLHLFEKKTFLSSVLSLGLASFAWRLLFLVNLSVNRMITGMSFQQLASPNSMMSFVLINGLIGLLIIGIILGIIHLLHQSMTIKHKPSLWISTALFAMALVITFFI